MKKYCLYFISIMTLLTIWEVAAYTINIELILPKAHIVIIRVFTIFLEGHSYTVITGTLTRLVVVLILSCIVGVLLGVLAGMYETVKYLLEPVITITRSMPIVSIIVIILIWVGYDLAPYIISFLLLVPIIYQGAYSGVKNISKELMEVLVLYSEKNFDTFKTVYVPLAFPFIKNSFLQACGLGIKVLVVAEFLSQSRPSIGYEIYYSRNMLEYVDVFAWTIILVVFVFLLERFIKIFEVKGI